MSEPERAKHFNITCDECGVCPMIGIRYKATHIYDYDVCESCIAEYEETEREKYVAIEKPLRSYSETRSIGPSKDSVIEADSLHEAAEKIAQNMNIEYAFIHLTPWTRDDESSIALQEALSSNTHIRIIHIHMCCNREYGRAVTDVARGIMRNRSIKRVFWSIARECRCSTETAPALCAMIEQNPFIESLILKRNCHCSGKEEMSFQERNDFAATILKSLDMNGTIKTFRLDCDGPLSEKNKEYVLNTVQKKNCPLKKVFLDFATKDLRLELLLACNHEKWIERITDTNASREDQLRVLMEAMSYESVEPVSAAYHLLRNCSDLLLSN